MIAPKKSFQHQSKTQALSEHLVDMARDLGPGAKMPTVQELRRELNISIATLDSALAQLESRKVIERKHGVGIFVSPHLHQKAIGLICDPAFFRAGSSPFWQQMIEGARERSVAKGDTFRFYLAIPSHRENLPVHDDLIEDVRAGRLHGALFIGHNKPAVFWLKEQGVPSVAFAGWSECSVHLDYADFVRQAAQTLTKKGCAKLGLLVPWEAGVEPPEEPFYSQAAQSLQRFAKTKKIDITPEWIWEARVLASRVQVPESHEEQGYQAALSLFKNKKVRPDGLIITDDLMTRGAMRACEKLNLQLGRDLEIVSHGNRGSSVLRGYDDGLTVIEFDPAKVTRSMFDALESLMNGDTPPAEILIKPEVRKEI
jgi:DNA-binding LacI/PurR family transcriptional regulator